MEYILNITKQVNEAASRQRQFTRRGIVQFTLSPKRWERVLIFSDIFIFVNRIIITFCNVELQTNKITQI